MILLLSLTFIYKPALVIHIICGATALLTGLLAIVSRKGGATHRRAGKFFFISMLFVCFSALYISLVKSNVSLLHIALFALYMNYSGYRAVTNKHQKPTIADWIALGISFGNSFFMISSASIILLVFGVLSILLTILDLRIFILLFREKEIPDFQWLRRHVGMMLGTYIATSTAFLVVNISDFHPAWVPWLLPALVGTPLIAYWTRKYSSRKTTIRH